jgi:hypothetical protein
VVRDRYRWGIVSGRMAPADGASSRRSVGQSRGQSRHDEKVAKGLADGDIRLLSPEWLRSTPDGFILSRRQLLPEDAFVPCDKAKQLFEADDRSVGVLSYGWLTPLHSDPHGFNAALVIAFLRSDAGKRIHALFWDFASCPQKDDNGERSNDDDARFKRGLKSAATAPLNHSLMQPTSPLTPHRHTCDRLMSALYASAGGTCVCVLRNIPTPPHPPLHYNQKPYFARGWCTFEYYGERDTRPANALRQMRSRGFRRCSDPDHRWCRSL